MHIHILGICGTFMAGIAQIAAELGHEVKGCDSNVYPPMSTFLTNAGIEVIAGYDPGQLNPAPDLIIIGNALSRGNPAVEYVLNECIPYTSGPAWLAQAVLKDRHVLAVAGTHGKTTTTSLLTWLLDRAGLEPGFLVGGIPANYGCPARLGSGRHFVIEADEYDTAFFDKRSKFVHYMPQTLLINNIEFDHADIFPDLEAIKTQFHHVIRTVPGRGKIVWNADDPVIHAVLAKGCWSRQMTFGQTASAQWRLSTGRSAAEFRLTTEDAEPHLFDTPLSGLHNAMNTLAACAAAADVGVSISKSLVALQSFKGVKRRLELLASPRGISVYDDFAHHPTAIAASLAALRGRVGNARIIAVVEPRSNTMRLGVHQEPLAAALAVADHVVLYTPGDLKWDVATATAALGTRREVHDTTAAIVERLAALLHPGDHVLIMSNGSFEQLHGRLLERLSVADGPRQG